LIAEGELGIILLAEEKLRFFFPQFFSPYFLSRLDKLNFGSSIFISGYSFFPIALPSRTLSCDGHNKGARAFSRSSNYG
jgi:hypothetical protein